LRTSSMIQRFWVGMETLLDLLDRPNMWIWSTTHHPGILVTSLRNVMNSLTSRYMNALNTIMQINLDVAGA
jgi:hypothetical protein